MKKLELPISGMSGAGCVSRIEMGLSKIQGVSDAKVNRAAEKASIAYDLPQLNSFDLVRAISELGYKVKTQKVILPVQGMSCASCVNRIKATLRQVTGVVAANINFATEKAAVEYILGRVTIKDLVKAIEAAGYKILKIAEFQMAIKKEVREAEFNQLKHKCFGIKTVQTTCCC